MRLSDAIRLGSLTIKPLRGIQLDSYDIDLKDVTGGCAIGMAVVALGKRNIFAIFPWVMQKVALPCDCLSKDAIMGTAAMMIPSIYYGGTVMDAIVHLFNYHVCTTEDWTIDQLCEWVASIEPAEETVAAKQPILTTEKELVAAI